MPICGWDVRKFAGCGELWVAAGQPQPRLVSIIWGDKHVREVECSIHRLCADDGARSGGWHKGALSDGEDWNDWVRAEPVGIRYGAAMQDRPGVFWKPEGDGDDGWRCDKPDGGVFSTLVDGQHIAQDQRGLLRVCESDRDWGESWGGGLHGNSQIESEFLRVVWMGVRHVVAMPGS